MTLQCDVLVLGGGLAGMRAAWAALEENPEAKVVVAWSANGPSGSSFANRNDRLGFQAPEGDDEKRALSLSARALGRPGYVDEALVDILVDEAAARVAELAELGCAFRKDGGVPQRVAGCFTPNLFTGVVMEDLQAAYTALAAKTASLSARFVTGYQVVDLLKDGSGAIVGAVLDLPASQKEGDTPPVLTLAKTTILALGGPASLFAYEISGTGNTGIAYGLMQVAGAQLANEGFIQFMWHELPGMGFFDMARLAETGTAVRGPGGDMTPMPEGLTRLATARVSHAPAAYQLPDAELDRFLAGYLDITGFLPIQPAGGPWLRIAPMAHAGNGGAKIDAEGRTTVKGLFAVGECATGMHGANRVGGAMASATQVFGRRAGIAAARQAKDAAPPDEGSVQPMLGSHGAALEMNKPVQGGLKSDAWLRESMQRYALLGGRDGLQKFKAELGERIEKTQGHALRLRSARCIATHLLGYRKEE